MAGNLRGTIPAPSRFGMPGEAGRSKEERLRGFGGGGLRIIEYLEAKKVAYHEQHVARIEVESSVLAGCVVYIDGSTRLQVALPPLIWTLPAR